MPTFAARIADAARRFPDRIAVERVASAGVERTTYRELMSLADRWSEWLPAQQVGRGDRVAILADNDAPWIAAYLGILQTGALAVPLDTAYRAHQIRAVLDNSGAKFIITTPRYLAAVQEATGLAVGSVPQIVAMSAVEELLASASLRADLSGATDDDPAVVLSTSGTTAA